MTKKRKATANRPSQADQEFVTNSHGEKVRNVAYQGRKSTSAAGGSATDVKNDFSSTGNRKVVRDWSDIDIYDSICDLDFSGFNRENPLEQYDSMHHMNTMLYAQDGNVYYECDIETDPLLVVEREILRFDDIDEGGNYIDEEDYIDKNFGDDRERYEDMVDMLTDVYVDGLVRYSRNNDSPSTTMDVDFLEQDYARVKSVCSLPEDSGDELRDLLLDNGATVDALAYRTPDYIWKRMHFVQSMYEQGRQYELPYHVGKWSGFVRSTLELNDREDRLGDIMRGQ